jgi:uncharacterized membrane protein YecN with MAPEG domain
MMASRSCPFLSRKTKMTTIKTRLKWISSQSWPLVPVLGKHLPVYVIYYVFLQLRVVYYRQKYKIGLGDGSRQLEQAIAQHDDERKAGIKRFNQVVRSHANFTENVPFALVLLGSLELNRAASLGAIKLLHRLLIVARVAHAEFGLMQHNALGRGRAAGTVATQAVLLLAAWWGYRSTAAYL